MMQAMEPENEDDKALFDGNFSSKDDNSEREYQPGNHRQEIINFYGNSAINFGGRR